MAGNESLTMSNEFSHSIVGTLRVNQRAVGNMEVLERLLSVKYGGWVKNGGAWAPEHCKVVKKVEICTWLIVFGIRRWTKIN